MKSYLTQLFIKFLDIFNLRFPRKASFIVLASHGNGHNALWVFLQKCGVRLIRIYMLRSSYTQFCFEIFKNLITLPKNQPMALSFDSVNFEKEELLYRKISQKLPALLLVRDPISILRSHINLYRFWNHTAVVGADGTISFPKPPHCLGYDTTNQTMIETSKPDVSALHLWAALVDGDYSQLGSFDFVRKADKHRHLACICVFQSAYERLKDKISQLTIIDMNAILPENAFATLTDLAQTFGFAKPLETEQAFYASKLYSTDSTLYPLALDVSALFGQTAGIRTTKYTHDIAAGGGQNLLLYWSNVQRLEYFLGFGGQVALDSIVSFLPNSGAHSARWWCKSCDTHWFEKLDTTIEYALKEALQRAQDWCSLQQQTIASHKVSEYDIIAYCAQNPALFARLQKALDYETKIVRERAPEIFAQWRYYQQFLQIQGD